MVAKLLWDQIVKMAITVLSSIYYLVDFKTCWQGYTKNMTRLNYLTFTDGLLVYTYRASLAECETLHVNTSARSKHRWRSVTHFTRTHRCGALRQPLSEATCLPQTTWTEAGAISALVRSCELTSFIRGKRTVINR